MTTNMFHHMGENKPRCKKCGKPIDNTGWTFCPWCGEECV